MNPEPSEHAFEAWKETIAVQRHFNELSLRLRNFMITLLIAVLGASAIAIREKATTALLGTTVSLGTLICAAGIVGLGAFYLMDRHWYHRLLYGAVNHGLFIEERYTSSLPELGLTHRIKQDSPSRLFGLKIGSIGRLRIFYFLLFLVLAVVATTAQLVAIAVAPDSPSGAAPT